MMHDSRFHTCTPSPASLHDWRVQRAVKKFLARDSTRGREVPGVASRRPRVIFDREQDNLGPAKGILIGVILGSLMWLTIYLLWPTV